MSSDFIHLVLFACTVDMSLTYIRTQESIACIIIFNLLYSWLQLHCHRLISANWSVVAYFATLMTHRTSLLLGTVLYCEGLVFHIFHTCLCYGSTLFVEVCFSFFEKLWCLLQLLWPSLGGNHLLLWAVVSWLTRFVELTILLSLVWERIHLHSFGESTITDSYNDSIPNHLIM